MPKTTLGALRAQLLETANQLEQMSRLMPGDEAVDNAIKDARALAEADVEIWLHQNTEFDVLKAFDCRNAALDEIRAELITSTDDLDDEDDAPTCPESGDYDTTFATYRYFIANTDPINERLLTFIVSPEADVEEVR